jgi:integrase
MAGSIRSRGNKTWELTYDVGRDASGKRIRRFVSFRGTRREAEKHLTELLHRRDTGIDIAPDRMTVAQYLARWLRDYGENRLAKSTLNGYRHVIAKRLSPQLGPLRLQELRPAHIQDAYAKFLAAGLSPRTVEYYHTILREALKHAMQWQLLARNPADAATPPRPARPEVQALSPEEAGRLLDAAAGSPIEPVIVFALHTGMRQGEILALTWRDVDLVRSRITVTRSARYYPGEGIITGPTKTPKSRREIALAQETLRLLKEHRKAQNELRLRAGSAWSDNDLVFPGALGQPWPARDLYRLYQKVTRAAGLPDARFHDLRHTAATLMLRAGVDAKTVSERLGHTTVAFTLNIYAHSLPDMEVDAAERLAASIPGRHAGAS